MTNRAEAGRNLISWLGAGVATVSGLLFGALFVLDSLGLLRNPYLGILTFIVLPVGFLAGLLLVPIGLAWARRRGTMGRAPWPALDLNDRSQRRLAGLALLVTVVGLVILSTASYGAVRYMASVQFCGSVCHGVMEPEFTAYRASPHARVPCVDCHVGSGAANFAEAKLVGVRQLALAVSGMYARPIPAPPRLLRPARETCERCHWPEKLHGDAIREIHEYANDEQSSETVTTLRIHVGGGSRRLGVATGIHWHMNLEHEVEYVALDRARQEIPLVILRLPEGAARTFMAPGVSADAFANAPRHTMDCMDCHNRPSHVLSATPERAVDAALAIGRVDRVLPFVRREMVAAVAGPYPDRTTALVSIRDRLVQFYREGYPEAAAEQAEALTRVVRVAQDLYRQNVFPAMAVDWGTYTNEIGHTDSPGCFRCHDAEHRAADGSEVRQDCDLCHAFE